MSKIGRWGYVVAMLGALLGMSPALEAQSLRGDRIDLHAVKDQIGMVTAVADRTAWIRLPQRSAVGQTVSFMFYSDGGDTMATGKIAWTAPTAPYEAYVTGIHAASTRHSVDPYDSADAFEVPAKRTKNYGARPQSDGMGVSLAKGLFARTAVATSPGGNEVIEPVRANIAALRAVKPSNRIALAIADAAARALLPAPETEGRPDEDSVDYVALALNLERYQKLRIEDRVVDHLLKRLLDIAAQNGGLTFSVSADFLRPPGDVNGNSGLRRP
jgi:hypothetical protein